MESKRGLTVGYLRNLIKDLPDDMAVCESDWDTAHLTCYIEQALVDGGHLLLVSQERYPLWTSPEWSDDETYPIPEEWKE